MSWGPHRVSHHTRALLGVGMGLNLIEVCGTGINSENFNIVNACVGMERDWSGTGVGL